MSDLKLLRLESLSNVLRKEVENLQQQVNDMKLEIFNMKSERPEKKTVNNDQEEWEYIYKWITEIRTANYLSISSFLESCHLNPKSHFYRHIVCFGSSRPSYGNVKAFLQVKIRNKFSIVRSLNDYSFELAICAWNLDNLNFLRKHSRFCIIVFCFFFI